jgi:hypothetical protein
MATSIFDTMAPVPVPASKEPISIFDKMAAGSPGPANPFLNAATSAVSSVAEPLANLALRGVSAAGGMSDADLQQAIHTHPLAYDQQRLSGKIGSGVGMAGAAVGSGPLAPALFGALGGESEYENVEARRAQGQQISGQQAFADVAGQTALNAGIGYLAPGGRISKGLFQDVADPLLRVGGQAAVGGGEMVGFGRAGNAIRQATGVDANPQQNDVENFVTGAAFHGVPAAGRELLAPNALAAARARTAQEQTPATPEPSPEVPALRKSIADLNQRLTAQRATESGDMSKIPAAQETPKELAAPDEFGKSEHYTFERPESMEGEGSFKRQLELRAMEQRMAEVSRESRRQDENPQAPEEGERRFEELSKNATFQTPEEVNPKEIEALNAFQRSAGDHAVREEYGEAPKPAAPQVGLKTVGDILPDARLGDLAHGSREWRDELDKQFPQETSDRPTEDAPAHPLDSLIEQAKRLASEESGGISKAAAGEAFLKQDVIPSVRKGVHAVVDTLSAVNKAENLGFRTPVEARKEALAITKALADAKIAGRDFEATVAPHIPDVPKFKSDRAGALHWADQVEATGSALGPKNQPAVDALIDLKNANAARAKQLGLSLEEANELNGLALSRQFKEPAGGRKGGGTVQGDTSTLISQKYDTFSEAYNAAERKGLVPEDDNPLTMQVRAQYEMQRILGLREQLRASENGGSVTWSPNTEPVPDGHAKITDRIAQETRRQANPTWVVAKYAKGTPKEGGFDKDQWLDDNAKSMIHVQPGQPAPDGYTFNKRETPGTYHAGEDTARMWNNATAKSTTDPLAKIPGKVAQELVKFRYDFSPVHAINGVVQHTAMSMGNLMKNLPRLWGGGEGAVPVSDIFKDLNIFGPRTNEMLAEIQKPGSQSPEVQDLAKRIQQGGADIKSKSILDPDVWRPVVDKFQSGNWQGGTISAVDALRKMVKAGTYDHVLNRIAAIQGRQLAESQVRQGVSADDAQQTMQDQARVVNRALGRHVDSPEFKNSILREAGKLMAPAWTYRVGLMKNIASAIAGNPHAKALVVGTLINTAIGGAAAMAALTYANTGQVQLPQTTRDYWNPKTGRKDANGHDERITFGPAAFGARMIGMAGGRGIADELKSSMNPAITGAMETVENRDYAGNQIRPDEGSAIGNFGRGLGHIARGMVPMSASSQYSSPQGEEQGVGTRIAKEFGVGVGHPATSDAEQVLYDALGANQKGGRNREEQARHDNDQKWVGDIRAGRENTATDGMGKDPAMSETRMSNVFKRASAKQNLGGLVHDPRLTPQVLLKAWVSGSDEDREAMKEGLQERLNGAHPTNEQDADHWQKLAEAIGE